MDYLYSPCQFIKPEKGEAVEAAEEGGEDEGDEGESDSEEDVEREGDFKRTVVLKWFKLMCEKYLI